MSNLIKKTDLTRWNRSGLKRFRYVDGNAITYLEALRLAMRRAFSDEAGINRWQELDTAIPVPAAETAADRQARWLTQYRDERRDYGWEILRTYARSAHVLTEHLNAYANESYLATATQWDNVRRLVEMIDYHPAPPASASTPIALFAKADKSGTVAAGFAFKNKPDDGSKPAIFETLADLTVDHQLNDLRARDWNQSRESFQYDPGTTTVTFPLSEPPEDVAVGTLGVLIIEDASTGDRGVAVSVTGVQDDRLTLDGEASTLLDQGVFLHRIRLLLKPAYKASPRLTGSNIAVLNDDHGLSGNEVVAWLTGGTTWHAARVLQVEGNRVRLSKAAPDVGTQVFLAASSEAQKLTIEEVLDWYVIMPVSIDGNRKVGALFADNNSLSIISNFDTPQVDGSNLYDYVSGNTYPRVYYVPAAEAIATVQNSAPQGIILDGDPGNLTGGDWLAVAASGGTQAAAIAELKEGEDSYELVLTPSVADIITLYGDFEIDIRPRDYDVNATPVFVTDMMLRSDNHSIVPLKVDTIPEPLEIGRKLIVAGRKDAMQVTVKEVFSDPLKFAHAPAIKVAPAIPGSELAGTGTTENYTRFHTKIYGNVVLSGHGESQTEKILGAGDATRSSQQFDFDVAAVSFVTDGNFPPGVRAAVEIAVDNRTYQQVPTLNDSDPEDPHYVVRMKEDGTLAFEFGDGRRGRRLPSGTNNVRIRHRIGVGLSGNLPPFSLEKEVKPHPLIDSLLQPMASTGGNDMEGAESMRQNAPASVLTIERAVSLTDFTHLATGNSSVWQARAFRLPPGPGRADRIEVAVVPAGGGILGTLGESLKVFLEANALPGVQVSVVGYQSIILDLNLTLSIKEDEYDPDLVAEAVRQAVLQAFALKEARLGEPLFRSQVFEIVEAVEGVENCRCAINPTGFRDETGAATQPRHVAYGPDGAVKRISTRAQQVIYMDEDLSILSITSQAFSL
jgi:hypothetical protein